MPNKSLDASGGSKKFELRNSNCEILFALARQLERYVSNPMVGQSWTNALRWEHESKANKGVPEGTRGIHRLR
jgi:hypothetical protein